MAVWRFIRKAILLLLATLFAAHVAEACPPAIEPGKLASVLWRVNLKAEVLPLWKFIASNGSRWTAP